MVGGRLCQAATAGGEQLSCADNNQRTNERRDQLDAEQAKAKVPDAEREEQDAANDSLVANVEECSDALTPLWRAKVAKHIDRHSAARFEQTAQSSQKWFAKGTPCEAIATKQVDGDVVEPFMAHCHVREGVSHK